MAQEKKSKILGGVQNRNDPESCPYRNIKGEKEGTHVMIRGPEYLESWLVVSEFSWPDGTPGRFIKNPRTGVEVVDMRIWNKSEGNEGEETSEEGSSTGDNLSGSDQWELCEKCGGYLSSNAGYEIEVAGDQKSEQNIQVKCFCSSTEDSVNSIQACFECGEGLSLNTKHTCTPRLK